MLHMIDLFAGTGAFTHAFEDTKHVKCVFANDMNKESKTIYDANFSHELTLHDLNDVDVNDIPPHDILTGGFPCQPFSIAGKREGFDDPRSNVFWKILEIVDKHSPKCIVLENVKNLLTHDDGNTFETIQSEIAKRGYNIHYKVLNTSSITNIPQHRERIYIVCLKDTVAFNLDFDTTEHEAIQSCLETDIPSKYYYTNKSSTWNLLEPAVKSKDTVYQYRRVYVRENKSKECPTLTANMGSGGHNVPIILDEKGIRKLTPRECFNFQGFPKSYKLPPIADSHLYKLAGNAVSLPVVQLIANRLVSLLMSV
jgi:DNA (cytosine-5)-methyltransferase 1